ncbi:WD40_repeat protein [Hexamita inflata]|uniref:WD40 repeat protein n=1 Tax=Hexamita inflata TaxID=28002 RepID=A0AA86RF56_9EUKA|nr:WD40 repeat protein [Hexamita inflata]CAI9971691.1 WD40 repeat protein [Hexamita inflata]CAI9971837.1 WD40 repeat protein [Hexamita inflata]
MEPPQLIECFKTTNKPIRSLAFNSNQSQLCITSDDAHVLCWNLTPPIRALKFLGHKDAVTCSSYARDFLVTGSADATVRLWTPNVRGDSVFKKVHSKAIRSVDVSQDQKSILTASDDKSIKIFDTDLNFRANFTGHANWVKCAKFSPDQRLVASCSDDQTLRLWDVRTQNQVMLINSDSGLSSNLNKLQFSMDGTFLAVCGFQDVQIWDIRSSQLLQHYSCASGQVADICFGNNDKFLVAATNDGVKVLDVVRGRNLYTVKGHEGPCTAVAYSPDSSVFASGGQDGRVLLFEALYE